MLREPGVCALLEAMSVDEPELRLPRWALRQALLGACVGFSTPMKVSVKVLESAAALAFVQSAQAGPLFDALFACAEALCPLEALAHRTEETHAQLEEAQTRFSACVNAGKALLPLPPELCGGAFWRLLAGIGLCQEEWLRETGFVSLSPLERKDALSEAPAMGWHAFL
jgi:hypothetical protein